MTPEKTVLIVEDDGIVAMDIEEELSGRGWRCLGVAGTLDAATQSVERCLPDLAVLDVNLRGCHSYDLARLLRDRGAAVVFLSGNSPLDLPQDLRDCAFVQKPVSYEHLVTVLTRSLPECAQIPVAADRQAEP